MERMGGRRLGGAEREGEGGWDVEVRKNGRRPPRGRLPERLKNGRNVPHDQSS